MTDLKSRIRAAIEDAPQKTSWNAMRSARFEEAIGPLLTDALAHIEELTTHVLALADFTDGELPESCQTKEQRAAICFAEPDLGQYRKADQLRQQKAWGSDD